MIRTQQLNKTAKLLFLLAFALFSGIKISAQCIPDTVTCVDTTGLPGEFCPLNLPNGGLNTLYDETVTIIPPGSYDFFGNDLNIFHIEIDSVLNLPPGIDYFPNADIFFPDTAYCIQLTGTPTQTGVFDLAIYITATVDFGGPIRYQVVDDTSISITIVDELGIDPGQISGFQVFQNVPNPFVERTRLAYYTPRQDKIELSIYNILGVRVHQERVLAVPGRHNFGFDGSELPSGTYLYRVETSEKYYTGKFMKSR
jgi:hypothetical protein